jgi:hypothetical protein
LTVPLARHTITPIEYRPVSGEAGEIPALSRNCEFSLIVT